MSWRNVVNDFIYRRQSCEGNTASIKVGASWYLALYGNLIAAQHPQLNEAGHYRLAVTTAGYPTKTTLSRLNALPGVSVVTKKGQLYLNGELWSGDWSHL